MYHAGQVVTPYGHVVTAYGHVVTAKNVWIAKQVSLVHNRGLYTHIHIIHGISVGVHSFIY